MYGLWKSTNEVTILSAIKYMFYLFDCCQCNGSFSISFAIGRKKSERPGLGIHPAYFTNFNFQPFPAGLSRQPCFLTAGWYILGYHWQLSVSPPPTSSGPTCSLQLSASLASAAQPFWQKASLSLTIRETSLNHCKESPETQTKASEAPQAAVTELLVVVLVGEALQVEAMELLLRLLKAPMAMEEAGQPAVVTELRLVAADCLDMLPETVNPAAAVDPAEGGEATGVDVAPPAMDRLVDTPVATLSALAMDLPAEVEDRGDPAEAEVDPPVGRLVIPMATLPASLLRVGMGLRPLEVTAAVLVECLLKVVTVLLPVALVAMKPKLVIRGGGGGGEGMEGGMEEREGREEGMEGA